MTVPDRPAGQAAAASRPLRRELGPRGRGWGELASAAVLGSCLLASAATLRALEADRGPAARGATPELALLPPPVVARALALSYDAVAADLLWVRTILYFGVHVESDRRFPKLAALLELVVALDPHFLDAYRTGALLLSFFAHDLPAAVQLLERGAQALPEQWELPHDLGRLYMILGRDPAKAMTWFKRADAYPGRPDYVPRMVAKLATQAGHREVAIELWFRIYRETENAYVREQAAQELRALGLVIRRGPPGGEAAVKRGEDARR